MGVIQTLQSQTFEVQSGRWTSGTTTPWEGDSRPISFRLWAISTPKSVGDWLAIETWIGPWAVG